MRNLLNPKHNSSAKKTYLVTGAAGFIGARFIESCNRRGIQTLCVDHLPFFTERKENAQLDWGQRMDLEELFLQVAPPHKGELSSIQSLQSIDAIVHLGAISDTSASDLKLLNRLNLEYSQALWIFATQARIPLIYASSAATYGDGNLGYDDDEEMMPKLKPLNAYGISKLRFDLWALAQERFGLHPPFWSGFKFFNVYGYGERHKGFMSSVVLHAYEQILKSSQVTLFKSHREGIQDGYQMRDFIYVEDVVETLHFALNRPIQRGVYNLGTGQARPFLDLAKAVFHALGMPVQISFRETPEKIRDQYQYFTEATITRLKAQGLDFSFTSLEDGVEKYVSRLVAESDEESLLPPNFQKNIDQTI